jgi:hypothetical protein
MEEWYGGGLPVPVHLFRPGGGLRVHGRRHSRPRRGQRQGAFVAAGPTGPPSKHHPQQPGHPTSTAGPRGRVPGPHSAGPFCTRRTSGIARH